MGAGLEKDDPLPELIRAWVLSDHRGKTAQRIEAVEEIISYWVPISTERDLRIEALEHRLAALERASIPESYKCVAHLVEQVEALEATVWELRRRLDLG